MVRTFLSGTKLLDSSPCCSSCAIHSASLTSVFRPGQVAHMRGIHYHQRLHRGNLFLDLVIDRTPGDGSPIFPCAATFFETDMWLPFFAYRGTLGTDTCVFRALTPTFAFDPHQVGSGAVCTADPGEVDGLKTPNSHRVLEQRMQNWVPRKSGTERAETGQVISHNYADYRPPAVLSTPSTPSAAD